MAVAMDTIILGEMSHIVHTLPVDLHNLVPVAAGYTGVCYAAVFVQRLSSLTDDKFVLQVGGEIVNLISYAAGTLFYLSERCYEETVLVHAGIGGQI